MAFFPLFYVELEPSENLGTLNEGLYIMTFQTDTTDVGVLVGLSVSADRVGHLHVIPEYNRPRKRAFPSRQYLGNIQLMGPPQLFEWLDSRRLTLSLVNTEPSSQQERELAKRWFMNVAQDLKNVRL